MPHIPVVTKDVDDWGPKDFCKFIQQKLSEKGIEYHIQYPEDIVTLGAILNIFKKNYLSQHALVELIVKVLSEYDFRKIKSLGFLRAFVMEQFCQTPLKERWKEKRKKWKKREGALNRVSHDAPPLTSSMKQWLQKLKDENPQ